MPFSILVPRGLAYGKKIKYGKKGKKMKIKGKKMKKKGKKNEEKKREKMRKMIKNHKKSSNPSFVQRYIFIN